MTDGIADVLNAAADRIEAMPDYAAEQALRNAGGFVFAELFEQARQVFGLPAIVALERYLHLGQLQHWQQTDRAEIVAALRAAAKGPAASDVETVALRRELDELHFTLAEAVGWMPWAATVSPSVLVREVADRVGRLEKQLDKARAEVAQLRGAGERNRKYVQYLIDEHGRISSELAVVNRDWLLLRNTEEIDAEAADSDRVA